MAIDISEYKSLYITTARDLIVIMKQTLEGLKTDPCNKHLICEFHRAAHSFKSQSLVMGYTKSGIAAKLLEQIFRDMKEQSACVTEKTLPIFGRIVHKLGESVSSIEQQQGELDLAAETDELSKLTSIPVV